MIYSMKFILYKLGLYYIIGAQCEGAGRRGAALKRAGDGPRGPAPCRPMTIIYYDSMMYYAGICYTILYYTILYYTIVYYACPYLARLRDARARASARVGARSACGGAASGADCKWQARWQMARPDLPLGSYASTRADAHRSVLTRAPTRTPLSDLTLRGMARRDMSWKCLTLSQHCVTSRV